MNKCRYFIVLVAQLILASCGKSGSSSDRATPTAVHSSSLALSPDGRVLFVVNPDADSVSVLDVSTRVLKREIPLGKQAPASEPDTGNYAPAIMPRALALSPTGSTLYVTAQRANALLVVDVASGRVQSSVPVGSEPIGVVVSPNGDSVYVACSQDATVVRVDSGSLQVTATAPVAVDPWALALSADGSQLFVTHLLGPGLTEIEPHNMTAHAPQIIPDTPPRGDRRLAHGQVRGIYDAVQRPGTSELWVAHTLLGTDTPQPKLDFESTAFPALSIFRDGVYQRTSSTDAEDVPGIDGSFADVVSGPHALAFTPDGRFLLMVAANSEDVLIVDAVRGVESGIVRPLPGKIPEGIVLSPDGSQAYVDERVSGDVAVLRLDRSTDALRASVDGPPIARLSRDPMPEVLRLGQALFDSANSTRYPITTDHWLACATCHMEGRSDAVTWLFAQGPRDTPSNAGGMLGTGFLFRTADRKQVQDYWHTINVEQGGRFDPTAQSTLLDALTAYVNHGIPLPMPPTTDASLVQKGAQLFALSGCNTCHSGDRFTDSGTGNATLDLAGTILLHDVGTCVTAGTFPDVDHTDVDGHARTACAFDTPSLNGIGSSWPYLHDGSAASLNDAVRRMPNAPMAAADLDALVEYLRSL